MLIGSVAHNAEVHLIAFIHEVNQQVSSAWGVMAVRRQAFKEPVDNDALLLALKPVLQEATKATLYFMPSCVYIAWSGMQRRIERGVRDVLAPLCHVPLPAADDLHYFDPFAEGNELGIHVKKEFFSTLETAAAKPISAPVVVTENAAAVTEEVSAAVFDEAALLLDPTLGRHLATKRQAHMKLHILVVEDQPFLRQLLFEALNHTYVVHMAGSVKEGFQEYLKVAPHIVFLDIGLPDGSGHQLAQKLKQIDPAAHVVMLTGSRERADVEAARDNSVQGFIVKPFNKLKIQTAIDRYVSQNRSLLGGL